VDGNDKDKAEREEEEEDAAALVEGTEETDAGIAVTDEMEVVDEGVDNADAAAAAACVCALGSA